MPFLNKAGLYLNTMRHLRWPQIGGRVLHRLKRSMLGVRLPQPPLKLKGRLLEGLSHGLHDPWNDKHSLERGCFCFLNEPGNLGFPPEWRPSSMPLLWQFNLHYFNYLSLLDEKQQLTLCTSWIESNGVGSGVGWHAYPVSLRIVNWCSAGLDDARVLTSLYEQAAFLYRNVEHHIQGNHLIENARALVIAGLFFESQGEAPRWVERGGDLLEKQLAEQFLPDGGHYERSPMYHALMLEVYLDICALLPASHPLVEAVQRVGPAMIAFLEGLTHPDGTLALFNDTTHEIAPPPRTLLRSAKKRLGIEPAPANRFSDSGYYVYRDAAMYLVIDGGPVGPDHLPAHAHADIFSYEVSFKSVRMIVDSGVYEYQSGPMRDYVRSTKAHNTVTIKDLNQVECWSSFRVARRWKPRDVSFVCDDAGGRFEGYYDGYAHLIGDGIVHQRQIEVEAKAGKIVVSDVIEGAGRHRVASRIHLHPDVQIRFEDVGVTLHREGISCTLQTGDDEITVESGWYCPEFGKKIANKVLVIGGELNLPARLSYSLTLSAA